MMRILAILALFAAVLVGAPAAPADAAIGGQISHHPDAGFDPPIRIKCQSYHDLVEGKASSSICADVNAVWVHDGEEIWCLDNRNPEPGSIRVWFRWADATGSHAVSNSDRLDCVVKAD